MVRVLVLELVVNRILGKQGFEVNWLVCCFSVALESILALAL